MTHISLFLQFFYSPKLVKLRKACDNSEAYSRKYFLLSTLWTGTKYIYVRPEDLSSAVFWLDSVYLRTTTEHPEDLYTLYIMWLQKRNRRTFGVFSSFLRKHGFAILWTVFRLQKSPFSFIAVRLVCFFPLFLETKH